MTFAMDTGNSGAEGPWISWSARGTLDGEIPAKSFYLRDDAGKATLDAFLSGVVIDIETMRTGWQKSDGVAGVAPEWKWNATLSKFEPQPGDEWKRGFEVRCAIGGGKTATWQQAGAAAFGAIAALAPELQQQPAPGKLPMVKLTGSKPIQFKRGSTVQPVLSVVKWIDRPDCLKEGAAAGMDTGNTPEPAPAPQPVARPAEIDDSVAF